MTDLPKETTYHKTTAKPIMAIMLLDIPLLLSGYTFINTLMYGKEYVMAYLVVSFSVFAVFAFFIFKKIQLILAKEPLITLTQKGIRIGLNKFTSWNDILNIRVESTGERTHLVSYLIFSYNGGMEKVLINELTTKPDEIYKAILRYRADSNFTPTKTETKKVDDDKEDMINRFFKE